jgi:Ca2+-binding RTX toxin-like protein
VPWRDGRYGSAVSWLTEKVAPAGSASTASRNGPASSGPATSEPPSSVARAAAASASAIQKSTLQCAASPSPVCAITATTGRDRLVGGPGDDTLIDEETDAEAARDIFVGGTEDDDGGPGDMVSYAKRRRSLGIDLRRGTSSTEDRLLGVESITAGSGDDRLAGDRDENWLIGGVGDDVVHGRRGRDIPQGGTGADRFLGEHGDDVIWGDAGRDALFGGAGEDFVISREEDGARGDDQLDCGDASDTVRSDSADTLTGGCESLSTFSNGLNLPTLPAIDADSASFSLRCSEGSGSGGCSGTLTLSRLDGELLGTVHFSVPDDSTATQVAVPLIPRQPPC